MNQDVDSVLTQIKNSKDYFQKARLLLFLKQNKQMRVSEIARRLNLKPAYVSHILRLNRLPELVKDGYYSQLTTISHLFIISRLKRHKEMSQVYEKVLSDNLTTLQTEAIVREMLFQINDKGEYISKEEAEEFAKNFNSRDHIKTRIIQSRLKGKFIVEIKGNLERTSQELRKIMKLMGRGS